MTIPRRYSMSSVSTLHCAGVRRIRVFLLLYLLSGAAALLYEVVWLRLLTLSMGHTAGAVGTVLAAFMGGLAAGAGVPARLRRRRRANGLATYAARNHSLRRARFPAVRVDGCQPVWSGPTRTAPAEGCSKPRAWGCRFLISIRRRHGASTNGCVAYLSRDRESGSGIGDREFGIRSTDGGVLYASNTIGSRRASATGFVMLPLLASSARLSSEFCSSVRGDRSLLLRRGPFELPRREPSKLRGSEIPSSRWELDGAIRPRTQRVRAAPCTLAHHPRSIRPRSSGSSLVYEVTWTRILAMILGRQTYASARDVCGLSRRPGLGSAIAAAVVPRIRRHGLGLASQ